MISLSGWHSHNIWEHSRIVADLYRRRARNEAEEMTCAAQAAELVATLAAPGDRLLDAGCGSGYFFHSLRRRDIPVEYFGVDATAPLIAIGQAELPPFGLPAERLTVGRIEDLEGQVDHVVCMNVLSNLDNYHRPLERLLKMARKSVILRESIKTGSEYHYVVDRYLDDGKPLRVHVNSYDRDELVAFLDEMGFDAEEITDRRTQGKPELVIDHPHYWTFVVARRR